ncbi:hypothetical protein ACTFIR_005508 [Dictyostelium discoideum]
MCCDLEIVEVPEPKQGRVRIKVHVVYVAMIMLANMEILEIHFWVMKFGGNHCWLGFSDSRDTKQTLSFANKNQVKAMIKTLQLENVNEALLKIADARFRHGKDFIKIKQEKEDISS